jgi:hypothetical protein
MRLPKFLLTAAALLSVNSVPSFAADHATSVPDTPQARISADVISRADRAIRDYILACSLNDGPTIGEAVINDAVFEFALDEPGSFLTVDATSLRAHCAVDEQGKGTAVRISNVWIFPTGDSNSVFVHYTTSAGTDQRAVAAESEHLALLEMRGNRIAKLRDFTPNFKSEESSHALVRQ